MNFQQLQYLAILAQTENYTQAAKMLHITQPSLTYAIKKLEEQVDLTLFKRVGRNVRLTNSGRIFVKQSMKAINTLNQAVEQAKEAEKPQDIIKISTLRSLSTRWLPFSLKEFLSQYRNRTTPKFQFTSGAVLSQTIVKQLRAEQIDIGFCSKIDNLADIEYYPVYEQQLKFITPLGHPLAAKKAVNLKDTLDYQYITYSKAAGLHVALNQLFSICGGRPQSRFSVDEDEIVAGLVAAGFGVGIVPEMNLLATLPLKQLPIVFPKYRRFIYMATLKAHYQSPAATRFIHYIRQTNHIHY
ncbi:LysR family transcriptional regulator [Loigolactobacillus rennini]|uniref:LysR family transcriptional regulator n=2 Tax=Loigolactobacillus rennini TaxID=238013 RepID=A0A0R2DF08_9LACO|nr:LysR family transcriptional regulator [Loigolactobacillus rennini]KRM99350.1 LysR family transcriptional regulator [Loigolactobacillus rennini DSM 20253]SFZ87364.1 Chromosome initiation inhibitor [Loigolactobacillus rennini]